MDRDAVLALLRQVADGEVTAESAAEQLRDLPVRDLGFARLDTHRALRCGHAEVVYGEGKTEAQVAEIMAALAEDGGNVLATRVQPAQVEAVREHLTPALAEKLEHDPLARTLLLRQHHERVGRGLIAVVCAGTSDLPVAREALNTCSALGHEAELCADVGVAGLHRLLAALPLLRRASVVIVVAGMEAALGSAVSGLVDIPVVAVPTSVGYGASFGGLTALLSMLTGCAPGVTVVNIDNGFGAGYAAVQINAPVAS